MFLTRGKVKHLLLTLGPPATAEKLGHKLSGPALRLVLSAGEPEDVRRKAISALVSAGAGDVLIASLGSIPKALRGLVYDAVLSHSGGHAVKRLLVEAMGLAHPDVQKEVRKALEHRKDPALVPLLRECLFDRKLVVTARIRCAELLAQRQGPAALPTLIEALRGCALSWDDELIHHLVAATEALNASGPDYEHVLIDTLRSINVYDVGTAIREALSRLSWYDVNAYLLLPRGRVVDALSRIGTCEALSEMEQMLATTLKGLREGLPGNAGLGLATEPATAVADAAADLIADHVRCLQWGIQKLRKRLSEDDARRVSLLHRLAVGFQSLLTRRREEET